MLMSSFCKEASHSPLTNFTLAISLSLTKFERPKFSSAARALRASKTRPARKATLMNSHRASTCATRPVAISFAISSNWLRLRDACARTLPAHCCVASASPALFPSSALSEVGCAVGCSLGSTLSGSLAVCPPSGPSLASWPGAVLPVLNIFKRSLTTNSFALRLSFDRGMHAQYKEHGPTLTAVIGFTSTGGRLLTTAAMPFRVVTASQQLCF
mmetsp:Transcript_25966/g.47461  ORF Transcript_25966/g.47461 Transcript_25966/m.47461 type:complete len:214 (-) Transcript_25966:16-657(-)